MVGTLDNHNPTFEFSATTTGDPRLLEADLYVTCAGAYEPIIVAIKPSSTSAGPPATATFTVTYDDSWACPGGTIYAQVTNGYSTSPLTPLRTIPRSPTGSDTPPPSPAISSPTPGSVYLQYDAVIAVGSSVQVSGGTNPNGVQIEWRLTGPQGSGYDDTLVGSGTTTLQLDPPIPNGWKPGVYTLTQWVTDQYGQRGRASTTYTVLPDPGHLGVNVSVAFNPQTLYVPSNGNDVTVTVRGQGQNLGQVSASSVRIVTVGATTVSIPIDTAGGGGWSRNSDGSYTAKFSRQAVSCAMSQNGYVGFYVPVVITASGPGFTIRGFDPANPTSSPATTPAAC